MRWTVTLLFDEKIWILAPKKFHPSARFHNWNVITKISWKQQMSKNYRQETLKILYLISSEQFQEVFITKGKESKRSEISESNSIHALYFLSTVIFKLGHFQNSIVVLFRRLRPNLLRCKGGLISEDIFRLVPSS